MHLNRLDEIVHGEGAAGVWVDNRLLVPSPAGKGKWFKDSLVIFQTGANELALVNQAGQVDVLEPQGATTIVAADGDWAVFLADGKTGVRTSWGLKLPEAAVLGMVPGTLFVKTSFQQGGIAAYSVGETNPALTLWDINFSTSPSINDDIPQFSALDALRCVWLDDRTGRLRSHGLPEPATLGAAFDPFLVEPTTGDVWIGYHTLEPRFLLHRLTDSSIGAVVQAGDTFGTNGQVVGRTGIECCWSTNAAQTVVATKIVRLTDAIEDLTPAFETPDVAPFGRKVGVLPFYVNHPRYGTHRKTPGHGEVLNNYADAVLRLTNTPYIADPSVSGLQKDCIAIFSDTRYNVADDRAVARERKVPLVLYHDAPDYPAQWLKELQPTDFACIQAYLQKGETPRVAASRIATLVARIGQQHQNIALAWMSYTGSDAFPVADVLALQPLLVAIVRAHPAIKLILPFAWARDSGCLSHPELGAWVEALVGASDGLPTLVNPPPPPPIEPPAGPFPSVKEPRMKNEIVGVKGPKGLYGRMSPGDNTVYFDRTSVGAHEQVEVSKPDDKFALRFVAANRLINFPGLWSDNTPMAAFDSRPADQRGVDESPEIVTMPNGTIVAMVSHGSQYSAPLTIVRQPK